MANQLKEEIVLSTQHFDKKIEDVIRKVENLKKKGESVGNGFDSSVSKMIQRMTGFNGSATSLLGTLGKMGGRPRQFQLGYNLWIPGGNERIV